MRGIENATLTALAAALLTGLIVGVERGWSQRLRPAGTRIAGVRTFGLLGLVGGLAGALPDALAAALVLGAAALLAIGYRSEAESPIRSATTPVAGLLTLALGVAAVRIAPGVALGGAAVAFALLAARPALHRALVGLSAIEVEAAARFLLIALLALPLLPDRAFGPFDAWNPRRIWMVVVIVAGLSFAGYAAARRWGSRRGLLLVAATGAIVSSTAVTADYARRLRSEPEARSALVAGIALASIVMFLRVQVLALMLVPRALPSLAMALAPATLVAAGFALAAWRQQGEAAGGEVRLGNPLDFRPALVLAVMVALFSLIARWALARYGDAGMGTVLALTGMMDVDAAVLTLAGLAPDAIGAERAGLLLAGPVLANTLVKAVMALVIAPGRDGWRAATPLLAALAASGAGLAVLALRT
ncbi:MgtC/SapB family protein [Novosphingobium huizhouense]|uniref:MgtC/SapB family protein n=1 Tax=Novosphingobium huizhouense TaxID=2866625 RepID=UPI001CD87F90|nr:DUF4010 domain-containing protein [Novosphingobium huizhouense]